MLPRAKKLLLVASTGGHLAQLVILSRMIEAQPESLWATFNNAQSRSLLQGRRVAYVDYVKPRDITSALGAVRPFNRLLRSETFDAVVSTGAAVAVPALLVAASRGIPGHYVESISRFDGPSLTGRLVERVPRIRCYTQHRRWAGGYWTYDVSIAEQLSTRHGARPSRCESQPTRVFVTLGTIAPYRFDALVDNVIAVLPDDAHVTWQLGSTARSDLPGEVHSIVSSEEFDRLARDADVVVSHAGMGSALRFVDLGVIPILVPRRKARHEHVDDHQQQAARELAGLGAALVREAGEIARQDLVR